MSCLAEGLRGRGHNVAAVNYFPSYLDYSGTSTIDLGSIPAGERLAASRRIAAELLQTKPDLMHYYFGMTLALDFSDLAPAIDLGISPVMHHFGSDVRRFSLSRRWSPDMPVKDCDEGGIMRRLEMLGSHIRDVVAHDVEMYELVKDFYERVHFIPSAIRLEDFEVGQHRVAGPLRVVHAPTSRAVKGSDAIIESAVRVCERMGADLVLVEGMSHDQAKQAYEQADVIIDQILAGGYGLVSIEAMALGKAVVCWISDWRRQAYPPELPVVSADRHNLEFVLTGLLSDRERLAEIGNSGRRYVEKYHSVDSVIPRVERVYDIASGQAQVESGRGVGRWSW